METIQINLSTTEKQYTLNTTLVPMIAYILPYLESNPQIALQIIQYSKAIGLSGGQSACGPLLKIALSIFFVWIIVFILLTVAKAVFAIGFQIINGVILTEAIVIGDVQVKTTTGTSLITVLANLLQPLYSAIYPETLRNWSSLTMESAGILYAYMNKAIADFVGIPISPIDVNFFQNVNTSELKTVHERLFLPFTQKFTNSIVPAQVNEQSSLSLLLDKTVTTIGGAVGGGTRETFQYIFDYWNLFSQKPTGPQYETPNVPWTECANPISALLFGKNFCGDYSKNLVPIPEVVQDPIIIQDVTEDVSIIGSFVALLKDSKPMQVVDKYWTSIATNMETLRQKQQAIDREYAIYENLPEVAKANLEEDSRAKLAWHYFLKGLEYFQGSRRTEVLAGGDILDIVRQKLYKYVPYLAPVAIPFMISNLLESQTLFSFFSLGFVLTYSIYDLGRKLFFGKRYSFLRTLFLPPFKVFYMIIKKVYYSLIPLFVSGGYKLFNLFDSIAEMMCIFIGKGFSIDTTNSQDVPKERKPEKLVQAALGKKVTIGNTKKQFKRNIQENKPLSARENINEAVNDIITQLSGTKVDYEDEKNKEKIVGHLSKQKSPIVKETVSNIVTDNIKQIINQAVISEEKPVINEQEAEKIIASNVLNTMPIKVRRRSPKKRSRGSSKKTSKKKSSKKSSKKRTSKKTSQKASKKRSVRSVRIKKLSKKRNSKNRFSK